MAGAERGVAVRRCHVCVRGPRSGRGAGALRAGGGGGRGRARAAPRGRRRVGRRARPPAPLCRLRLARVPGDASSRNIYSYLSIPLHFQRFFSFHNLLIYYLCCYANED